MDAFEIINLLQTNTDYIYDIIGTGVDPFVDYDLLDLAFMPQRDRKSKETPVMVSNATSSLRGGGNEKDEEDVGKEEMQSGTSVPEEKNQGPLVLTSKEKNEIASNVISARKAAENGPLKVKSFAAETSAQVSAAKDIDSVGYGEPKAKKRKKNYNHSLTFN